jgi:hypothetical protein
MVHFIVTAFRIIMLHKRFSVIYGALVTGHLRIIIVFGLLDK